MKAVALVAWMVLSTSGARLCGCRRPPSQLKRRALQPPFPRDDNP
jgi:hypothetical protein